MVRILIADDYEVVRLGLSSLLANQPGWEVQAEATTVAEAVQLANTFEPDVMVMDIRLGDGSGIEACQKITRAHSHTKVIIFTSFPDEDLLFKAISAGAVGFVLKQAGNDDLVRAIGAAARGEGFLDSSLTGPVLNRLRQSTLGEAFAELSRRELDVLPLIVQGKTYKQIAAELHLSQGSVQRHITNILHKLRLSNRAQVSAYAMRGRLDDYLASLP